MHKRAAICAIHVLCLFASAGANAIDWQGYYVGIGVGQATSEAGDDFAGSDTSFRLLAGYSFIKYLSAEVVYLNAGTAKDSIGPYEFELKTSSLFVSAVGTWPIGRWVSLSGKLGYAFYKSDQAIRLGNLSESRSNSDGNFAGSAAAALNFSPRYSVRLEYEAILVEDGTFGNASLNGVFRF